MLELATVGKTFGKLPSEIWGILDRDLALDFDRLCNLRLTLFAAEIARKEAAAIKGESDYSHFPRPVPPNQPTDFSQLN